MNTLLLLSLFLFPAGTGPLNASAAVPVAADASKDLVSQPTPETPDGVGNSDGTQIGGGPSTDHLCLKIRAFIFKTNDDRAPEFVRETTCMPVIWRAEKVNGTAQPRLIPATSGSHY